MFIQPTMKTTGRSNSPFMSVTTLVCVLFPILAVAKELGGDIGARKLRCQEDKSGFRPVLDKIKIASPPSPLPRAPKILCFVNTHEDNHDTKVKAIRETWGTKCDKLVFASSKTDESLDAVRIPNANYTYDDLWGKHRETLRHLHSTYKDEYDWFLKADDDTYVITENLRAFLGSPEIQEQHQRGDPLHIGNPVAMWIDEEGLHDKRHLDESILVPFLEKADFKLIFNVGGAGYAMNHAFLENLMEWIDRPECAPTKHLSTLLDDTMLSVCSASFGAFPYMKTRDSLGRERFHQESPSTLYTLKPGDMLYHTYVGGKRLTGGFQVGEDCCSSESVTFHHLNPSDMHDVHDLMYLCREEEAEEEEVGLSGRNSAPALITDPAESLRSAKHWPPFATVKRIADEKGRIVLMIVNCGMLDFADNLIASMLHHNVTNFVLVPRDETSYKVLLQVYPDNVVPPIPYGSLSDSGPLDYKSDGFIAFNKLRPRIVRLFLQAGFHVMYTDVDTVWHSNVLELMEHELGSMSTDQLEAMFVQDNGPGYDAYCSCLMYLKSTPSNRHLLQEWEVTMKSNEYDQPAWNRAIQTVGNQLSFRSFNATNFFPSGYEVCIFLSFVLFEGPFVLSVLLNTSVAATNFPVL